MSEIVNGRPSQAIAAMLEQGFAQLREGALERAVETFTTCLAVTQSAPAFRGRAWAKFHLKDWAQASLDFDRAKILDPADIANSLGLAVCLAMENKVYEAIKVYEEILASRPDHVRAHIQLGLLHYKLCAVNEGRKHLEAALKARPSLEERRIIEKTLKEQKDLDKNRYFRPDFEALHKADQEGFSQNWLGRAKESLRRIFK